MPSHYISSLRGTSLSDRGNKDVSQNSSHSSPEEESYECDLSSFVHQFNFTRTEAESLTLDEFLGVPAKEINKTDSLLNGLLPQGSLSDLSDLLAELDNIDLNAPQISASRLSMLLLPEDNEVISSTEPTQEVPLTEFEKKIEIAKKRLENANLKKITTTIYLFDANNPQSVQITSLSTPETIINNFLENGKLKKDKEWIITEIHEAFGVERVMKPWEPVLDVIDAWESECHSALLIRARSNESTTPEVPRDSPLMAGWLQIEIRRGKWEKRFIILKRGGIYVAKSENSISSATLLCSMQNFDAFTLNRPRVKSPKKPQFALKSQQSIVLFEKPEDDYIHFFACSSLAELDTWMRALRYSRSWVHYEIFLSRPATAALFSPFVDESILTDNLRGIDLDAGQYSELEGGVKSSGGNSTLTRNTPGAIAGRLFRLVLTGDQGKTDIDKVVGSKPLPNVFSEGSLLSKPHVPKATASTEETEVATEDGEVFKEGSLLSRGLTVKKTATVTNATEYQPQSGSLLSNITSSQKSAKSKPQPLTIPGGKGGSSPLLQLRSKDSGVFQTGTLLSKAPTPTNPTPNKQNSLSQWNGGSGNSSGNTPGGTPLTSPGGLFLSGMNPQIGTRQAAVSSDSTCESPTSSVVPNNPGSYFRNREISHEPPSTISSSIEKSPNLSHVGNVISQQQQLRKQRSQGINPSGRSNTTLLSNNGAQDPIPIRSYKSGSLRNNPRDKGDGNQAQLNRQYSSRMAPGLVKKPPAGQFVPPGHVQPGFQHPQYAGMSHPGGHPQANFNYPNAPPLVHSASLRNHPATHLQMRPPIRQMTAPNSFQPNMVPPSANKGPLIQLKPSTSGQMNHPIPAKKSSMKPLISFK